jgi:electron transport complex protein RnfG
MTGKDIFKVAINLTVIYVIGGVLLAGVYAWTSPIIFINKKEDKEAALKRMMPLHLIANAPAEAAAGLEELLPDAVRSEAEGGQVSVDGEVDLYEKALKKLKKKLKKAGATEVVEYSRYMPEKAGDWEPHHKHAEYYNVITEEGSAGYIVETFGKGYSSYVHMFVAVDPDFVVSKINVIGHAETPGLGDEIEVAEFKDQYRGKDLDHLEVIKGETEDKIQAITGATISTRAVTNGVKDGLAMLIKKYTGEGEEPETEEEEGNGGH